MQVKLNPNCNRGNPHNARYLIMKPLGDNELLTWEQIMEVREDIDQRIVRVIDCEGTNYLGRLCFEGTETFAIYTAFPNDDTTWGTDTLPRSVWCCISAMPRSIEIL